MGHLELLKRQRPAIRATQSPSADQVQAHIEAGGWQRHWSPILSQWVWFVRDERSLGLLHREHPDAVGYTLAELQELVGQCCGNEELLATHRVKMAFEGATVRNSPKAVSLTK